jgi:hypothetical protein
MKAAAEHPEIKEGFMELMKQVINVAITDILGAPPDAWHDPVSAPESERSGHS